MATNKPRARMWRSMRMLTRAEGGFTVADIVATATVNEFSARALVRELRLAGYVRALGGVRGRPGRKGGRSFSRYELVRDTGPHCPRVHRDGSVWDPNEESQAKACAH